MFAFFLTPQTQSVCNIILLDCYYALPQIYCKSQDDVGKAIVVKKWTLFGFLKVERTRMSKHFKPHKATDVPPGDSVALKARRKNRFLTD